jgi:hypothetical protein
MMNKNPEILELIHMSRVNHLIGRHAVGDLILGALITGLAIVLIYRVRASFRRNGPVGKSHEECREN